MKKWIKRHLDIAVLITLISLVAIGISKASVRDSEIDRLNKEVFGSDSDKSISVKLGKLEQKVDDGIIMLHRIEDRLK